MMVGGPSTTKDTHRTATKSPATRFPRPRGMSGNEAGGAEHKMNKPAASIPSDEGWEGRAQHLDRRHRAQHYVALPRTGKRHVFIRIHQYLSWWHGGGRGTEGGTRGDRGDLTHQ